MPPPLAASTSLPLDADGALVTDACLRAPADARVFGAGDCIAFAGSALPRVGVYAVRQAPVLAANLAAALDGRPLRRFRPQRRTLLIVSCGDGTGLALWGGLWWHGRLAAAWKARLDRRWLGRLRAAASAPAAP
ncbi:MAG: hypothetical protein KIT14_07900 [bacterium]|nr:hypothetical protein [bacterium]